MSSFVLSVSHPGFSDVLLSPRVKILNGSGGISGAGQNSLNLLQWNHLRSVEGEKNAISSFSETPLLPLDLCSLPSCSPAPPPPPSFTVSPPVFCPSLIPTLPTLPQWNLCPVSPHHVGLKVTACCEDYCMWKRTYVLWTQLLYFWCCELHPHSAQAVASSLLRAAGKEVRRPFLAAHLPSPQLSPLPER